MASTATSTGHIGLGSEEETRILTVDPQHLGQFRFQSGQDSVLDDWELQLCDGSSDAANLNEAAHLLRTSDVPVAFPTETVYGLGADATRSGAAKGIYTAKQRPSDNPLIVHIASLVELRRLLKGQTSGDTTDDPIPVIYKPLIRKFWPGPLTIILPNPKDSFLAPEVTAGLSTFGARMPRSILALALIKLAGVPLAAPSANASTKPSPTTAEHVKDDLNGRIELIIDGGPCSVGVESTVVDGLSDPPAILRPGGISLEQLRECPGWEKVEVGYKDISEKGTKPKAPGMKYRHYSPKAKVVLYEAGSGTPNEEDVGKEIREDTTVGIIRTKSWPSAFGIHSTVLRQYTAEEPRRSGEHPLSNGPKAMDNLKVKAAVDNTKNSLSSTPGIENLLQSVAVHAVPSAKQLELHLNHGQHTICWEINLGETTEDIARGLFSALRELDKKGVDVIFVEGIKEEESIAAAVMNRLRKAAEVKIGA